MTKYNSVYMGGPEKKSAESNLSIKSGLGDVIKFYSSYVKPCWLISFITLIIKKTDNRIAVNIWYNMRTQH